MSYNPDLPNGGLSPKEQSERLGRIRRRLALGAGSLERRDREADEALKIIHDIDHTMAMRDKWHGMGYDDDDILKLASNDMATDEIRSIAEMIRFYRDIAALEEKELKHPKQTVEPKEPDPIYDPSAAVIAGLILIGLVIFTVCLI
jgi:hypothetical protein